MMADEQSSGRGQSAGAVYECAKGHRSTLAAAPACCPECGSTVIWPRDEER